MNREETKEAIKVMQHFVDTGEVMSNGHSPNIRMDNNPEWNWEHVSYSIPVYWRDQLDVNNGILCRCANNQVPPGDMSVVRVVKFNEGNPYPFVTDTGLKFKLAEPVTEEELQQYLSEV